MIRISAVLIALLAPVAAPAHDAKIPPRPAPVSAAYSEDALPFALPADFRLTDRTGGNWTPREFAGRPALVFFGYASCLNTCGFELAQIGRALDLLGSEAEKLAALFVTVDPDRDDPASLAAWLGKIHPRLIGLGGEKREISKLLAALGGGAHAGPGGRIDHSSFAYLVGTDGRLLALLPPALPPERLADILRKYLG